MSVSYPRLLVLLPVIYLTPRLSPNLGACPWLALHGRRGVVQLPIHQLKTVPGKPSSSLPTAFPFARPPVRQQTPPLGHERRLYFTLLPPICCASYVIWTRPNSVFILAWPPRDGGYVALTRRVNNYIRTMALHN